MKKTAKKLMPIPEGYVVLTKESTSVKSQWIEQENNCHFRLAEYADGTTALYRVYPGKDLNHDYESVLVQNEPVDPNQLNWHYRISKKSKAFALEVW